jgi:ribosomal-protein-alanine N-acetyltransferase
MIRSTKGPPVLETARLRLRPMASVDGKALHAAFGDSECMRYWNLPPTRDLAESTKWVDWLAKYTPYSHAAWTVLGKRDTRVFGMVNYHHRYARNRHLEVGYVLLRPYWGQGFMTEAMQALLAHCFDALRVHRVEALIQPENAASIRVAERLGFRCEGGPLRDRWRVGESYRSTLVYALLEQDRRAPQAHS